MPFSRRRTRRFPRTLLEAQSGIHVAFGASHADLRMSGPRSFTTSLRGAWPGIEPSSSPSPRRSPIHGLRSATGRPLVLPAPVPSGPERVHDSASLKNIVQPKAAAHPEWMERLQFGLCGGWATSGGWSTKRRIAYRHAATRSNGSCFTMRMRTCASMQPLSCRHQAGRFRSAADRQTQFRERRIFRLKATFNGVCPLFTSRS